MSKKILIIGINGFLGNYLNNYLYKFGFDIYGTSHSFKSDKIFNFNIGEDVPSELIKNRFHAIIYLTHSNNTDLQVKPIKWYRQIFYTLVYTSSIHIYISSYSANNYASSRYGKTKYEIEQFFIKNNAYSISPGLIIGDGGIYKKIEKMVLVLPIVGIPTIPNANNLLPIINITDVCLCIQKIIENENYYKKKSIIIYEKMISLKELASNIAVKNNLKRIIISFNAKIILNILKSLEYLKIKIPVTSDSLKGFIANQNYQDGNDFNQFMKLKDITK